MKRSSETETTPIVPSFIDFGADDLIHHYQSLMKSSGGPVSSSQFQGSEFSQYINGNYSLWQDNDDWILGIRDICIKQDFISSCRLNNWLSLEYVIEGGSDMNLNNKMIYNNGMPRLYIASYDEQGCQTRLHKKGDHIRGIGLWLKPKVLQEEFGLNTENLPNQFKEILEFEKNGCSSFPINTTIKDIAACILDSAFEGRLAQKFLNAKVTELICYTVNIFLEPQKELLQSSQLSQHKAHAMALTLQLLNNNLAQPPKIDDIAKQVGLSRSNLLNTFRQTHGINISDYLTQQKMDTAQNLIRSGKESILETALAVGYNDQSAFGRAYKRYFGHPPKFDRFNIK